MATPIQTINFEGNLKIPTKILQKNVQQHIGKNCDQNQINAIVEETETYYRKHNYTLAFAKAASVEEVTGVVTIKIGKYNDFNERSIDEMKRRKLQEGAINQVFFEGNEKISTYRLTNLITPSLGKTNTVENRNEIIKSIQDYYRQHRYELAYAEVKNIDPQGIVTIAINKYPNFKALYAREGKTN
jgi:hemolysin activation/secretion protein